MVENISHHCELVLKFLYFHVRILETERKTRFLLTSLVILKKGFKRDDICNWFHFASRKRVQYKKTNWLFSAL